MSSSDILGTGWSFPPAFKNQGRKTAMVSAEEDVQQALEILFSTAVPERLFYPDFGCDMKRFMFEEVDHNLVSRIQQMIIQAIRKYEPRVEVEKIEISESNENANILLISIDYLILRTNKKQNLVYPFNIFN